MSFDSGYVEQVDLLLEVLPVLSKFDCFALKGGTAINLFIRNMPRLSVDIDLAYLPIEPRRIFLKNITVQLTEMQKLIKSLGFLVKPSYTKDQQLAKLFVYKQDAIVKIEPNLVIRGSAFDCEEHDLCQKAQDQFLKFSHIKTLSTADLYGGKICATLDRQHPRDLFDVKMLFNKEFSGMVSETNISFKDLIDARFKLIQTILNDFTDNERKFLMSFKEGNPDWGLSPIREIENLPAVKWKLENIKKIPNLKKDKSRDNLRKILGL